MTDKCKAIVWAVTLRFIATGEDSTVKDIAAALGWSETKVRDILNLETDWMEFMRMSQESKTTYSRAYPGMEAGNVRVWCYCLTRETMRRLYLNNFNIASV